MFEKIMQAMGGSILCGVKELISQFHMSPAEKAALLEAASRREHEIQLQIMAATAGQLEINKLAAAHPNWFVSGWRRAAGWSCVGGMVYQFIFRPIVQSVITIWMPDYMMVSLEIDTLMTMLFGMLGLGAYRSYEKSHDTARN